MSATGAVDLLAVTYGAWDDVRPLLASARAQTVPPARILVWHNGPRFDDVPADVARDPLVTVVHERANLGFGEAASRLFELARTEVVVVANPDVELAPDCLEAFARAAATAPDAALVAGALCDAEHPTRVNAHALSLTADLAGINLDRGRPFGTLDDGAHAGRYLGPSGALFAVRRSAWQRLGGGPLFPAGLFLYMEDVALGLRVRARGGRIAFAPRARGTHRFSGATGRRSALKLFHVERNRLWLLRALAGRGGALVRMPFTLLRYAAYAAQGASAQAAGDEGLASALLRGWRDGLLAPLPAGLVDYLRPANERSAREFVAPLREQLRDPTR